MASVSAGAYDVPDPILSRGAVSITVFSSKVVEEYKNPVVTFVPPQPAQKQSSGPKPQKVVNLLRVTKTYRLSGYIAGTDRVALRAMFEAGEDKTTPTNLAWDSLTIPGVITSLTLTRDGRGEQLDWDVDITFLKAEPV